MKHESFKSRGYVYKGFFVTDPADKALLNELQENYGTLRCAILVTDALKLVKKNIDAGDTTLAKKYFKKRIPKVIETVVDTGLLGVK